jgi:hypothetical protein
MTNDFVAHVNPTPETFRRIIVDGFGAGGDKHKGVQHEFHAN